MKSYQLNYAFQDLCIVKIPDSAAQDIKDMVNFWSSGPERLEDANGDYNEAWLMLLIEFIYYHHRLPDDKDEGWGIEVAGIKIIDFNAPSFEVVEATVQELVD